MSAPYQRTDADGRWESENGVDWVLVEPSPEYLGRLAQYGESDPSEDEMEQ